MNATWQFDVFLRDVPSRLFSGVNCRSAKGSFALDDWRPGQLRSLAGQEHGWTIPLADTPRVRVYGGNDWRWVGAQ